MSDECERSWQVDALREGRLGGKDAESFERHRRTCARCARRMAEDEKLGALLRALPGDEPRELTLRRLRGRVMRDVATGVVPREPARRAPMAVAALLVAAASAGAWMVLRGPRADVPAAGASAPTAAAPIEPVAGAVVPSAGARWTQARADRIERVRLDDGTIDVHVRPQLPGERFLVVLPDGELEVRGTTFTVTVEGGATLRVHVDEGVVELRLQGAPPLRLGASDSWATPPAQAPSVPRAPARSPRLGAAASTASGRVGPPAAASGSSQPPADDGAAAYAAAMQRLRDGDDAEAASAFHAFLITYPRSAMAEDASFMEAVALARAGRADAAALAAEHHLASFPGSFHRKEAAILVARAATSRGDCGKARAVLAPWPPSSDADVRGALRACAPPE
jgi:hypothetical protein